MSAALGGLVAPDTPTPTRVQDGCPRRTLSQDMEQMGLPFLLDGSDVADSLVDVVGELASPLVAAYSDASLPGAAAWNAQPLTPPAVVPVTPPSGTDAFVSWSRIDEAAMVLKESLATPMLAPMPAAAAAPAAAPAPAPTRRQSPRTSAGGKLRAARTPRTPALSGLPLRPAVLTVQQLREELRARNQTTCGHKPELVARLENELAKPAALQTAMSSLRRYKRPQSKREPQRHEFDTEMEFVDAWTRWREWRDDNNRSVKRSRERKRMQDRRESKQAAVQERENSLLEKTVVELKRQVALLKRGLRSPATLSSLDHHDLTLILAADEFTPLA